MRPLHRVLLPAGLAVVIAGYAEPALSQIPDRYRSPERSDSARAARSGWPTPASPDTTIAGLPIPMRAIADAIDGTGRFLGDPTFYGLAIDIVSALAGPRHPFIGYLRIRQARFLFSRGEYGRALDAALEGENVLREHTYLSLRTLGEEDARRFALLRETALDLILTVAANGASPVARARCWDAFIRSRAIVLDEMVSRQRSIVGSSDSLTLRLAAALNEARQRLSDLSFRPPDEVSRNVQVQARARCDSIERELAARSAVFRRDLKCQRAGLDDVRRGLRSDEALVAFAYFSELPAQAEEGRPSPFQTRSPPAGPQPALMAFVVRGQIGEVSAIRLGSSDRVESLVLSWRESIESASAGDSAPDENHIRTIGDSLRRVIWDPIVPELGASKRVFVVMDGALQLLSLDALPADPQGTAFLAETSPVFQFLSCERDLARRAEPGAPGCGLLAMGAVHYHADSSERRLAVAPPAEPRRGANDCWSGRGLRLPELTASGPELRDVALAWDETAALSSSGCAADVALGDEATEGRFKRSCAGRRVIHLSTHGFFLHCSEPEPSKAPSWNVRRADLAPPPAGAPSPMWMAGLVLGTSPTADGATVTPDDGFLTAEEIGGLDLSQADAVVLSACETGVGLVEAREGVLGLRRSFAVAGASQLVVSLWPVMDEYPRILMRGLYDQHLRGERDLASSLRAASLDLLRALRKRHRPTPPDAWAPFMVVGVPPGSSSGSP